MANSNNIRHIMLFICDEVAFVANCRVCLSALCGYENVMALAIVLAAGLVASTCATDEPLIPTVPRDMWQHVLPPRS